MGRPDWVGARPGQSLTQQVLLSSRVDGPARQNESQVSGRTSYEGGGDAIAKQSRVHVIRAECQPDGSRLRTGLDSARMRSGRREQSIMHGVQRRLTRRGGRKDRLASPRAMIPARIETVKSRARYAAPGPDSTPPGGTAPGRNAIRESPNALQPAKTTREPNEARPGVRPPNPYPWKPYRPPTSHGQDWQTDQRRSRDHRASGADRDLGWRGPQ